MVLIRFLTHFIGITRQSLIDTTMANRSNHLEDIESILICDTCRHVGNSRAKFLHVKFLTQFLYIVTYNKCNYNL